CPGRMTRTRTAFSLATPSLRWVSYSLWFLDKVAACLLLRSVFAILVPRQRGEKGDSESGHKNALKTVVGRGRADKVRRKRANYTGVISRHCSCRGRP